MYSSLTVLETRSQDQGVLRTTLPPKSSTGHSSLSFPVSSSSRLSLVCGFHNSNLSLRLPISFSSVCVRFHKNIHRWILWPTQLIHNYLIFRPLAIILAKTSSPNEVAFTGPGGLEHRLIFWRATIQPTTPVWSWRIRGLVMRIYSTLISPYMFCECIVTSQWRRTKEKCKVLYALSDIENYFCAYCIVKLTLYTLYTLGPNTFFGSENDHNHKNNEF